MLCLYSSFLIQRRGLRLREEAMVLCFTEIELCFRDIYESMLHVTSFMNNITRDQIHEEQDKNCKLYFKLGKSTVTKQFYR